MPLLIRDAEIDALAGEVQKLTKAPTKIEAIRQALRNELARQRKVLPPRDRLARAKALADAMGPSDPAFNLKTFTDDI